MINSDSSSSGNILALGNDNYVMQNHCGVEKTTFNMLKVRELHSRLCASGRGKTVHGMTGCVNLTMKCVPRTSVTQAGDGQINTVNPLRTQA